MSVAQTCYAVINVPSKVGKQNWAKCLRRSIRQPDVTVVGVNEAFLSSAKQTFRRVARNHGWGMFGVANSPNPIFWDRNEWRKVSGKIHKLHGRGSRHDKWPGFNDARYMTEVVLENIHDGRIEVFFNTHWVADFHISTLFRITSRRSSKKKLAERMKFHQVLGRTTHVMGDTNWKKAFKLNVPNFQWIRGEGIDKTGVAPGVGETVVKTGFERYAAPTDHKFGIRSWARIRRPKKEK